MINKYFPSLFKNYINIYYKRMVFVSLEPFIIFKYCFKKVIRLKNLEMSSKIFQFKI